MSGMNSYHVLKLVGEGSYGRVYKGRRKHTGQVVALKFMPKMGRSEKELRSLKKEIEIMRNLQHPNIVQLYDSFETQTEVVVVTEYAEGQLFQVLEDDGNLPESQVREIACQLVSALYYLHSHRILHRDMKPQNILLGKGGVVKLCDFGFARAMSVSTMVLTSIKGTPLYMSPELVEERPYDHTAELWSLGCILYELHTGSPPFYTNSIFQLVQLIIKEEVKWPDTMSDTCMNFLKGLLTKDPEKRLSWPDLLHHPFVADGVQVLSDTSVSSPLTVTPSADMMARKLEQVAAKTVTRSGESRLLRKAREQWKKSARVKAKDFVDAKNQKDQAESERVNSTSPVASPTAKPQPSEALANSGLSVHPVPDTKIPTSVRSKHRGQISRDYELEFPSVEVGPRLPNRYYDKQNAGGEADWGKLAQASDPCKQFDFNIIIPRIKTKILDFKVQLTDAAPEDMWQVHLPLKVLRNLFLTLDLTRSKHISHELGLPHVLFDVVNDSVENCDFVKRPWSVSALGEVVVVIMIYLDKLPDWMEEEQRLDELTKPFLIMLSEADLRPLAPLAACVLSLFVQHNIDVRAEVNHLVSSLKVLLLDSHEPPLSPPCGWGICDGLLSLLLHTLSEHENGSGACSLEPRLFLDLWERIAASLGKTTPDTDLCSANGMFAFLSTTLFLFIKDPYACVPLFTKSESKCVYTLGRLLGTDCVCLFAEGCSPGGFEVDLSHDNMSVLSCHLLCFPFALDLPAHTISTVLQLYDSCRIVESLAQVIQTLPPVLLELPLSLLSRLLLCDPERSVRRLREAARGMFSPPAASKRHAPPGRSASSLLRDLLQQDELWVSAVELLTLLSQVARFCGRPGDPDLHLESVVLHQALDHPHDHIRAASCRLLGNLDPFRPPALPHRIFKSMILCLHDSCLSVRRAACRAVGNWLGYIAAGAGFSIGPAAAGRIKGKRQNKGKCSDGKSAGHLVTVAEHWEGDKEVERWREEARRTAALLASLVTDPDALTRRHCCAALGNLLNVDGAESLLSKEDVCSSLLRAACCDSYNSVRRAAIATLCLCSKWEAIRQVLLSLDAREKLVQASQHAPPLCDYHQLIRQLV